MANGNSDVKLVHGQVKVEAWDLCVDHKDRRTNDTPHRRAMVHDFEDGLTVNWGEDYPAGVTLNGVRRILGRRGTLGVGQIFRSLALETNILHLLSAVGAMVVRTKKLVFQGDDDAPDVELAGAVRFTDSVVLPGKTVLRSVVSHPITQPGGGVRDVPITIEYNLLEEISRLRAEVASLKQAVGTPQADWRWCSKCQGLFFAGGAVKGVCPAGDQHSTQGSGNYRVPQ